MGYNVYITRRRQYFDYGPRIESDEWRGYVAQDSELEFDTSLGEHFAVWLGPSKHEIPWLAWSEGNIESKYPDEPLLKKMCAIAEALGARVQDEDGRLYDRNGRTECSIPPKVTHRLKAWWANLVSRGATPIDPSELPFVVGDRVRSIVGPWIGTVIRIDVRAEHGLGVIVVRRDDGTIVSQAAIAHGLIAEPDSQRRGT